MKKRYEVAGMMEWHPMFRAGRTRIQVSFTGGHLCGGACTAASCEVADEVVQKVIENSQAFRSGRIRLAHTWEEDIKERVATAPSLSEMQFESLDLAADFLQFQKGVSLDRLSNEKAIMNEARNVGISLKIAPNS